MTMPLGLILNYKYRDADPMTDYRVQDDGDGPYIAYWDEAKLGNKPTTDELRSWWLDAEKMAKKRQLRDAADTEYDALLSPDGLMARLERDEVIEKKAVERAGGVPGFQGPEGNMSTKIDALRQKRRDRFKAVNDAVQDANETLEQAVERVRGISW